MTDCQICRRTRARRTSRHEHGARKTVVFIFDREYEETILALAEYLTAPSAANYDTLASIVGLRDANALITSANALILHSKR